MCSINGRNGRRRVLSRSRKPAPSSTTSLAGSEARELLRHRVSLVWLRTEIKNRLARRKSPRRPERGPGPRGQRALQALACGPEPSTIREDCGAPLRLLDEQIRRLDLELIARWGAVPHVQRLMTIPGIGPFTALLLVLELGGIHRFPSADPLASDLALPPRAEPVPTGSGWGTSASKATASSAGPWSGPPRRRGGAGGRGGA